MIEFARSVSSGSFIAFDPNHPYERLYLLLPAAVCGVIKAQFWDRNTVAPKPLSDLAFLAGGRHARHDYPEEVEGKLLGLLTAVAYFTDKKGDGPSFYIHKFGEESGILPIPCVDRTGRLWLAGGNYRSLDPGITD
jgi:hypothetical protein